MRTSLFVTTGRKSRNIQQTDSELAQQQTMSVKVKSPLCIHTIGYAEGVVRVPHSHILLAYTNSVVTLINWIYKYTSQVQMK